MYIQTAILSLIAISSKKNLVFFAIEAKSENNFTTYLSNFYTQNFKSTVMLASSTFFFSKDGLFITLFLSSDDLGRCVLVVGLPYPNIKSPELQEKLNYINRTMGSGAGSVYYENLCMKAVNQCIGKYFLI